jgi:short-subunit dehydrogenase
VLPGPVATEFHLGTGIDPARLPISPMDPGDVVTACLAALDLGETVCIPGLGDPAAIEAYHTAARQLLQASGHALASRYQTTADAASGTESPVLLTG